MASELLKVFANAQSGSNLWQYVGAATITAAAAAVAWNVTKSTNSSAPPVAYIPNGSFWEGIDFGKDPVKFLVEARKQVGDVLTVRLPLGKFTFVFGYENIKAFFAAKEEALSFQRGNEHFIKHIFGTVFGIDVEWDKLSLIMVAKGISATDRLSSYWKYISDEVDQALTRWEEAGEINIFKETSRIVMCVMIQVFIGKTNFEKYGEELIESYYVLEMEGFDPLYMMMPWIPTKIQRNVTQAKKNMYRIIDEVTQYFVSRGDDLPEEDSNCYFALMIKLYGTRFSSSYSQHVASMLLAAHTNAAGSTAWNIRNIATTPYVLEKVRTELAEQMTEEDDFYNPEAFKRCRYLDACLKESGRLQAVFTINRKAMEDFPINDKITIPKDHIVIICPPAVNMDETIFPDPLKFEPERFDSPEKVKDLFNSLQLLQFGYGKHHCLGEKLAHNLMKAVWVRLFSRYDVTLLQDSEPDYSKAAGTPFPKRPVLLKVTRRTQ